MTLAGLTIRAPVVADAPAVEAFLLSVEEFAGTIRPGEERENWKWLFGMDAPEADPNVLVAVDDAGRIVAHYGVAVVSYQVRDETVDAGLAGTLAIDKHLRTSDLFLRITMGVLKSYPGRGMAFVMGLTNREGLTDFHKTFGFRRVGAIPVRVKPLRFGRIARRVVPPVLAPLAVPLAWLAQPAARILGAVLRAGPARGLTCQPIDDPTPALDKLSRHVAASHPIFRARDVAALRWRYRGTPTRTYLLRCVRDGDHVVVGYYALRRMDMKGFDALALVDVVFDLQRHDVARAILSDVDRTARDMGCDLVATLASSKPLARLLRLHGFLDSPEHFELIVHEPREGSARVKDSSLDEWFVTWFDHDYV